MSCWQARCIQVAVLILLMGSIMASAADDGELEPIGLEMAVGFSGHTCVGVLGDPFFSAGVGSLAYLQDGFPTAEFGYQLSVVREGLLRTTVELGGLHFRTMSPLGEIAGWALGARVHRLPYESGFHTRSRWTLGLEAGFMAEVFSNLWARVSVIVLMDQPLITGYGYYGSGAIGIELAMSRYVELSPPREFDYASGS